ncbi:MAG: ABC transporter ATP-binding protein [Rhodobacteraceae bacterium]|nr:ABC transporter ATP-binding protein [Paracoccaceae bacterium]
MTAPIVVCKNIKKTYGKVIALDTLNLEIEEGQFVVLLGPSGSGKTTLLSILGGFTIPSEGTLFIGGRDVTSLRPAHRPTVTVFQNYALFPHMRVSENIGFGLSMRKVPRKVREEAVEKVLETVGLIGLGGRGVHELSGGQRQRVALARAIVVEPSLLLLDEPLGALDLKVRQQMQDELVLLQRRIQTTFVHVTHDQEEAMNIADVVVVINKGKIEDIGPPERVYLRPSSRFSASFMGESNIVPCKSVAVEGGRTKVSSVFGETVVHGKLEVGQNAHISIRPEQLKVESSVGLTQHLVDVQIDASIFQGAYRRCLAVEKASGSEISFRVTPEHLVSEGESLSLHANPDDFVLLTH